MEIVERSSGYWIVDEHGAVDGPFIELEEAQSFYNSLLTLH
tara:strand:+ start:170 stop:292 length:123 start_codon:yes stop_codon:yes gene_type:complete